MEVVNRTGGPFLHVSVGGGRGGGGEEEEGRTQRARSRRGFPAKEGQLTGCVEKDGGRREQRKEVQCSAEQSRMSRRGRERERERERESARV